MKFLLDTHALLWFCEGSSSLGKLARTTIEDRANDTFVSHATAWEVAIKVNIGRLKLSIPYERLFPDILAENGFEVLPLDFHHFRELLALPRHHTDPFDRLLIAQARAEGMILVSRDPQFIPYEVLLIW